MENQHEVKATDYLIESLKLMVTISMLFIGGIVAYGGYIGYSLNKKLFYSSIFLLVISSLLSVVNINSIINKIYAGKQDAIRTREVRLISFFSIITLLIGILLGSISILEYSYQPNKISTSNSTIITDKEIIIGSSELPPIKIIKNQDGHIQSIEIESRKH